MENIKLIKELLEYLHNNTFKLKLRDEELNRLAESLTDILDMQSESDKKLFLDTWFFESGHIIGAIREYQIKKGKKIEGSQSQSDKIYLPLTDEELRLII